MKIGIDVQPLQTGTRYAGVGHHLKNLLAQLAALDLENEYLLLLNSSDYLEDVHAPSPTWGKYYLKRKHRLGCFQWCWDTMYLPLVFHQKHIDIYHYHSLSEFEPLAPPFPLSKHRVVATVHDLIPLKFREQCSECFSASRWDFDYAAKARRLRYADAIITDSECSKRDIVTLLQYPPDRVFVVYNGVADHFRQQPEPSRLRQFALKYHLPEQFILYLGGYYHTRKNLDRLLDAYKLWLHTNDSCAPPLVLAGLSNPVHQQYMNTLIHNKQLSQHILCLPYIADEELPLLYRTASLFVYPTIYEGFGLPAAEAMASGTVVAASNCSSLPEVIGEAGIYFDPYDLHSIANALHEGLTNVTRRKMLQHKGQERARLFLWEQTAESVLAVYQYVANRSNL